MYAKMFMFTINTLNEQYVYVVIHNESCVFRLNSGFGWRNQ